MFASTHVDSKKTAQELPRSEKNHFIVDGYERNDENLEIIAHEDVKHVKVKIIVDNKCQGS